MSTRSVRPRSITAAAALVLTLAATSCQDATGASSLASLACTIPDEFIADGGPGKDGIPALTDPVFVAPTASGAAYLRDDDRVIGLEIAGEFVAVPLNIGWWHEVVNLNRGALRLAITHCPLTGSSLVFDRSAISGAEFGVSGLLFMNNLMLYDRQGTSSLWPQMARGARCGSLAGTALPMYPSVEVRWDAWRALHPTTTVVSSATGHSRDYQLYPYGSYSDQANAQLLAPIPQLDPRREPKERVFGLVQGDGDAIALPFGALRTLGARAVVPVAVAGQSAVVFWETAGEVAAAFVPVADGRTLTFRVSAGEIVDAETGSRWSVDGRAVAGTLTGATLTQFGDSFVAYWFAWAAFYPQTRLWSAT
jgi:hypothetical protein